MDHKNIVICSDGTGNTNVKNRGTNVFKLFEAVDVNGHRTNPNLRRQLAFYDDGVGTQELRWIRAFAGATGYGLSRNVKQLYRELCRVYEPGDSIYLFGFSRGAFTVRTLAGLITDCGILSPDDPTEREFRARTRDAYKAYRRKYRALLTRVARRPGMAADEFRTRYARRDHAGRPLEPCIKMLGVWDTVDAVGLPFRLADLWNAAIWQFKFNTTSLSRIVDKGCHALAMNDDRESFEPVLWDERDGAVSHRVEQVWFAGAHSNVGGGYPQQGMSLVALDWMMTKAEQQELRFTAFAHEQYRSQQGFADKLYNPRSGLGVFYRWKPRNVTRLCAEKGIAVPRIHVSVLERIAQAPEGYAPGNMPPDCAVVATEDDPLVDARTLSDAIAAAHGGRTAPPLIERQAAWVRVGLAAYFIFIIGLAAALARAVVRRLGTATDATDLFTATRPLFDTFPVNLVVAVLGDPVAASLLASGLALGYALSSLSERRTNQVYSAFWHRHRSALRTALRRTPAPEVAIDASAAPML
ncbi:MAG: DUF2235 domain-containing protein [Vicinamibacterales bacterium]